MLLHYLVDGEHFMVRATWDAKAQGYRVLEGLPEKALYANEIIHCGIFAPTDNKGN
jgi:hypothetical protein